jgi:hypothetical protein
MIFPFKIKLERAININSDSNVEDLMAFLKDALIIESSTSAVDCTIDRNELTFKVNDRLGGMINDTNGILKAKLVVVNKNNAIAVKYIYQIGGRSFNMISAIFLFFLTMIFITQKTIDKLFDLFWIFLVFFSIVWFATLYRQNRMLKAIVKRLENKFGNKNSN